MIKFANYTLKLASVGTAVAGAKLVHDKFASIEVVKYLGRSFQVLPKFSVVGLSVSAFALAILISAVSSFVINSGCLHLKILNEDNPFIEEFNVDIPGKDPLPKAIGKFFIQCSITVLTGIIFTLAATAIGGAIAGTSLSLGSASATGFALGAVTFVAKLVADFVFNGTVKVFDAIYYRKTNRFINLDVDEKLQSVRTKDIIVPLLGNKKNESIDITEFLEQDESSQPIVKAILPGSGKIDVTNHRQIKPLRKKALTAIVKEHKQLNEILKEKRRLHEYYQNIKIKNTNENMKSISINDKVISPILDRINELSAAQILWEKIEDIDI